MKNFTLTSLAKLAVVALFVFPIQALALPSGGGGGGSGLACGNNGTQTMPNNSNCSDPTVTDCFGGPGYYVCSDVDGDGCEDVDYSVENNAFYTFCAASGAASFSYTFTFDVSADQNLQATIWQQGVTSTCGGGCGGLDHATREEYGSGPGGTGTDFSMSYTLAGGECVTIMIDGYAGDADGTYAIIVTCPPPLEFRMADLNAKVLNDRISLSWYVEDEGNVDYYSIEKSNNAKDFSSIGKTTALNPLNQSVSSYSMDDYYPEVGTNYYRVKQVMKDNTVYVYRTIPVVKRALDVQLYPNPISKDLNLSFGKELMPGTVVSVYDVLGNVVYHREVSEKTSELKIDMDNCSKGLYFLSVTSDDFSTQQRFFKE